MRRGELDRLSIPENALDILAQQIVAICASEDWSEDDLFALVRRPIRTANLERSEFDEVVDDALRRNQRPPRTLRRVLASRSREWPAARAARKPPRGHHQRRSDSRQRALHRRGRAGRQRTSAPSTRISPSKVCAATSCSSATVPGASAECEAGRVLVEDAHGARSQRAFLARRGPGAHTRTFRSKWRNCGRKLPT